MDKFKYIWVYISDKDMEFFNKYFLQTPNLHLKNKENEKNSFLALEKNDIKLIHQTRIGPCEIEVNWKKINLSESFSRFLSNLVKKAHIMEQELKK